ncbi:hypothetical protein ACWCRB_47905, partial [Streptomyces sp. NPDC002156]
MSDREPPRRRVPAPARSARPGAARRPGPGARPAERTLRFLPGTAPGTADVRFADGRPFHD